MALKARITSVLPGPVATALALLSAILLSGAFPDLGYGFLAWIAFVPLFFALGLEPESRFSQFLLGWLFGTVFFFITCQWLTFAPITYAGFPVIPTYLLLLGASGAAGIFAGFFGLAFGRLFHRFGFSGVLFTPFLWTAFEFARLWVTGNNWNAVGYSQAFSPLLIQNASIGGVLMTGFCVLLFNALTAFALTIPMQRKERRWVIKRSGLMALSAGILLLIFLVSVPHFLGTRDDSSPELAEVVAVQPNVPMSGLNFERWRELRARQTGLAESAIKSVLPDHRRPLIVVLPESPMNFQYDSDPEFRQFINGFATRNGVFVLFNSAEPDPARDEGFFNSAVMIDPDGKKIAQYDKIYLLPFGEFVPLPGFAQELIPPMVGRFSAGREYDLLPFGKAKAGIMICFESHFGSLSREYVRSGADVIVEMTNDGYLGNTPVLRQHLANAVFRAVETRRPLLRVTNVGVTAYVDAEGRITETAAVYEEAVRTWKVRMSDKSQTLYVRFGEWFAILCCVVSAGLVLLSIRSWRTAAR